MHIHRGQAQPQGAEALAKPRTGRNELTESKGFYSFLSKHHVRTKLPMTKAKVPEAPGTALVLPCYAKINLGLRVLRRRPDGYHEIETIFQQIDLHDRLRLRVEKNGGRPHIHLTVDAALLPADASNLVHRAAAEFVGRSGVRERIVLHLEKRIPVGAGLGGGSSDAAVTLLGLNALFGTVLSEPELVEIARGLGADVPFFLYGGTAYATGIGDMLEPVEPLLRDASIVVVAPRVPISTAWAYRALKISLTNTEKTITLTRFLRFEETGSVWRDELTNDFENVVFDRYPQLQVIKSTLYECGATYASLSGSGSALFGIFADDEQARRGIGRFQVKYPTFLVKPIRWGIGDLAS